jgi:hypothetical protein
MYFDKLTRRAALKTIGASIPLPYFASLAGDKPVSKNLNQRLVTVVAEYGFNRGSINPEKSGKMVFNEYSKPFAEHKDKFSLFGGLDHPGVGGGHGATSTMLNGTKKQLTGGDFRKMESLDVKLANQFGGNTRFPLLVCGGGSPVSFNTRGIPYPKVPSPERLFAQLFQKDTEKVIAQKKQNFADDKSILDAVLGDARSLKRKLNKEDNHKFEEYLGAVRDAEVKVGTNRSWLDIAKPKAKTNPMQTEGDLPHQYVLFYEIMALALQTNSTKFITFHQGGGNGFLPVEGVDTAYHSLTHHGHRPERLRQLRLIDNWRYQHLAHFISLLKKYKDSDNRPLIDTTTVLFGSGMSDASTHSSVNNPVMLMGGGFKHGNYHVLSNGKEGKKDTAYSNLLVSVQNSFGVEKDKFSTSNGDLNHLLT